MEKVFAQMTVIKQVKKDGTKNVWIEDTREVKDVDHQTYKNIVDSAPFFRRLGGSETCQRGYTSRGYNVIRIVSTSPDKQNRTIRMFNFDL